MTRKHKSDTDGTSSQASSQIKMQPEPKSVQEMLSLGEEAGQLLNSPVYNLAHRSVVQNLQDEWMTTLPHEKEKREGLYQRIQALMAVAEEMAMMVEQARQISDDELANERKLQLAYDAESGFRL